MPLKLNVGVSRKVALRDYRLAGGASNIELELGTALQESDLDGFQTQIDVANLAADLAVHDELERGPILANCKAKCPAWTSGRGSVSNVSGIEDHNGHSHRYQEARSRGRKLARPSQVKAILAITRSQKADLEGLLSHEFDADRPEDLSVKQAFNLIYLLKTSERS